MSNIDKQALREAAEKYRATYAAHLKNPRDYDAVDAWDKATSEFMALVNNDELNIIADLLDKMETEEGQRKGAFLACNRWHDKFREKEAKLEAAEKRIAELEARAFNPAILDVIAERQRQKSVEGWTSEHDDEHSDGEMALAASSYALYAHKKPIAPAIPYNWPWEPKWFKQQGARRDLVKAGALILAEIERIDRAAGIGEGE
ncbi:ead/Ea22-like family protein [Citrobacter koseri]|uniref:ead/Ea22-like family protein n=1 Tax=Citrobacter koseri TaxID=545 RepID=UPI001906BCD5|nr:ead/Ea22-like family protein [Citrobacter koseri]MBJ9280394.1 ead/Ea22-like family protein [Citrobacter koseri]